MGFNKTHRLTGSQSQSDRRNAFARCVLASVILCLLVSCRLRPQLPKELRDSGIDRAPRVLTAAATVLFWLPSADTLSADSADAAIQLMDQAADDLRDLLADTDIAVLVTTGTRIYVQAPNAPRRIASLAGLDYPWGVLLVEPGYAEQIITGPVLPGDLRELVYEYFGLEDSDGRSPIALNSK
jgi:hypothetical protein